MNIYGINDTYRKKLYANMVEDVIEFLDNATQQEYDRYLHILVSDGYQILNKRKSNIIDDKVCMRLYNILTSDAFSHIKRILEDNCLLLLTLFVNAKSFWNMPILDRCLLVGEKYNLVEHRNLLDLDPFYLVDAIVYQLQKDMDSINHYHSDYLEKFGSKYMIRFYQLIAVIISNLKEENRDMYDKNMLEILKGFYICHKFLSKMDENSAADSLDYCRLVEEADIEAASEILSASIKDLSNVIEMYFAYQTNLSDFKDTKKFIEENINKEMIKKLKIDYQ